MKAAQSHSHTVSSRRLSSVRQDIGLAPIQLWVALASGLLWVGLCALAALTGNAAHAQAVSTTSPASPEASAMAGPLQSHVEALLRQQSVQSNAQSNPAAARRVEVVLGQLDPRLKLAPCDKVHAYMPEGLQLWGKTRVGLRCEQGPVRWNVSWPVTVKVWAPALVATVPLRPGMPIKEADVRLSEVDIAASPSPALVKQAEVLGRSVVHNIEPGQSLRQDDIRARRWFAAGDQVRLNVRGSGFTIASEGMALTPGDEGRCARVRTDNGRVVCAQPVGERVAELSW